MSIKKKILLRSRVAYLLVVAFAVAIIYKMGHIQWAEGKHWKAKAEKIQLQHRTVKATRGNIYSDNGSLLATSVPLYQVAFDPTVASDKLFNDHVDTLALLLYKHFKDHSPTWYQRKMEDARLGKDKYMVLNNKRIGYQEKKIMETWPIFNKGRMRGGVIFQKVEKRLRPFSFLGSRTIGYINDQQYGAGLEYSFNKYLAGTDGMALYQRIAGNWKPVHSESEVPPVDGLDIETTLDINLQDVAEAALHKHLLRHEANNGCVVVMEVATGEIKAISNLTRNSKGNYGETYNYAVGSQGVREPGSTIKLASMMALFEDTGLELGDEIETGKGRFDFYGTTMRDHKKGGFGRITVQQAFEKSSNIAVAKLVNERFGDKPGRFVKYLKEFGLTEPLGFHMMGAGEPYIKTPEDSSWSKLSLPWMSHGYELELSPLHTLTFFNAVANDGKMIRPIIVKRIVKADKEVKNYQAKVIERQICSINTLMKLRTMLEGVVERGTAKNIKNSFYKIAGKTGTAQKIVNGRYTKKYYTSFAGYFPAHAPRYSCIVVIDEPKGYNQYGSDVAAPVFKEIADKIYARDIGLHEALADDYDRETGVFPVIRAGNMDELRQICDYLGIHNQVSASADEWATTALLGDTLLWRANNVEPGLAPDVRGMTLRDALYVLENQGLSVNFEGRGRVVKQSLLPGIKVKKGQQITITLS